MSKVEININGRIYAVACDPGEEARVRDLGGMVDARMRQLTGPGSAVGETHLLVLVGLMLADELMEAKAGIARPDPDPPAQPDLRDENDDLLVEAVDHLADRIAVIADRLARA
jgi:cell division protein ZapA